MVGLKSMRVVQVFFVIFGLLWSVCCLADDSLPAREMLPELKLTIPADAHHRKYLGLDENSGESFVLTDIKADILLIELFSMYCPFCQREAPLVNELHEKMEELALKKSGGYLDKKNPVVKIIGLGATNSRFEVDHFMETYQVRFPLFPDKDMSMYRALEGAGTPTFIGCRLQGKDDSTIILRHAGKFDNSKQFLDELIMKSGL